MVHDLSADEHKASARPPESSLTRRAVLPVLTTGVATSILAAARLPAEAKQAASSSEAGTIWWNELRTRDASATRAFYANVIGWTPRVVAQDDMARPPAAGEKSYTIFTMRGDDVAGAEQIEPDTAPGVRAGWFTYVQVNDVDESARKVTEHGGRIVQPPSDVPGVGRMAEIEDPEGNRVGLVSPRA